MIMYYGAFQVGLSSLQQVLGSLAGLYEDNLFLTYFHEFETLERAIDDPPTHSRCRGPCRPASPSRT